MIESWFQFNFPDFSLAFASILLEGIPFILFGTLFSGFIDQFLPSRFMARILPRNESLGIFASSLLGLLFPICECGIVPVVRRLMAKGLPASHAITYMLAAPIVNPIVAVSTYAAYQGQGPLEMTALRLAIGGGVAILAGFAASNLNLHLMVKPAVLAEIISAPAPEKKMSSSLLQRIVSALHTASEDFLNVLFYFVFGAAFAAVFGTAVNQAALLPLTLDDWLATSCMMGLAFILCLCSTSDAFVAASFETFSQAGQLAFLTFGPMFDFKLLFLYSAVFTRRFVAGLGIGLFIIIGLICVRLAFLQF